MALQEEEGKSRDPLYSDYERIGNLLNEAQNFGKEIKKYNPMALLDFVASLNAIFMFLYPIVGETKNTIRIKNDLETLSNITIKTYRKLLTDKNYKVSYKLFDALIKFYQELLQLKQMAALGIRTQTSLRKPKIDMALE